MPKKLHLVHVKSNVLDKAPSAETLNYGEIAVNYNTGSPALYIKDSTDKIIKFISEPYFLKIVGSGVTETIEDVETIVPISTIIEEDEKIVSAALNDLNDRKADISYVDEAVSSITIDIDSELDSASTNPVENRVLYQIITDDEEAIASALNDLNARIDGISIDVDSELDSASTNPVENRVLYRIITEDEKVISSSLNNLNSKKADKSYVDSAVSSITIDVDSELDSASTNPVENRVLYQIITDDEEAIASALNDLNARIDGISIDVDSELDSASTNPVENRLIYRIFEENELIVASALNDINERLNDTITGVTVNGTNVHVNNHVVNLPEGLPSVSSANNGMMLRVVNGEWQLVSSSTIYSGSGTPQQSLGSDGDIYLQTS